MCGGNTQLPLLPNKIVKSTKAPSKSFIAGTAQLAWHHLHWTTLNKNKHIDCPITYRCILIPVPLCQQHRSKQNWKNEVVAIASSRNTSTKGIEKHTQKQVRFVLQYRCLNTFQPEPLTVRAYRQCSTGRKRECILYVCSVHRQLRYLKGVWLRLIYGIHT